MGDFSGGDLGGFDGAKIKTGTYTGDDGAAHVITGIGFRVKYVRIWIHSEMIVANGNNGRYWEKMDIWGVGTICYYFNTTTDVGATIDNALISVNADGFTVKANGAGVDPNANAVVYDFECIGE